MLMLGLAHAVADSLQSSDLHDPSMHYLLQPNVQSNCFQYALNTVFLVFMWPHAKSTAPDAFSPLMRLVASFA